MAITFSDWYLRNVLRWFPHLDVRNLVFTIHLYTNALVPSDDTALGDYVEATFCGYAPQVLPFPSDAFEDEVNEIWKVDASEVQFCRTCPEDISHPCETVYGYYVTIVDPADASNQWVFADEVWPSGLMFCQACDCEKLDIELQDKDVTPGPH